MPAKEGTTDKARELARAFIGAQRHVRYLEREAPDFLPFAEIHTLIALSQNAGLSPGDIASLLNTNLSKASRVVQRLKKENLVEISAAPEDGRQKLLSLTKVGRQTLRALDKAIDKRTLGWFGKLSAEQQGALKEFLAALASALNAPEEPVERKEVAIRTYQRRIARAGGLISGTVLAGDLTLIEYQILNMLVAENSAVVMERLFELPFDRALLSRTSDLLERIGLLSKSRDSRDSRRILVTLTEKGRTIFLKAEAKAASIIAGAIAQIPARRHNLLLAALKRIAS